MFAQSTYERRDHCSVMMAARSVYGETDWQKNVAKQTDNNSELRLPDLAANCNFCRFAGRHEHHWEGNRASIVDELSGRHPGANILLQVTQQNVQASIHFSVERQTATTSTFTKKHIHTLTAQRPVALNAATALMTRQVLTHLQHSIGPGTLAPILQPLPELELGLTHHYPDSRVVYKATSASASVISGGLKSP